MCYLNRTEHVAGLFLYLWNWLTWRRQECHGSLGFSTPQKTSKRSQTLCIVSTLVNSANITLSGNKARRAPSQIVTCTVLSNSLPCSQKGAGPVLKVPWGRAPETGLSAFARHVCKEIGQGVPMLVWFWTSFTEIVRTLYIISWSSVICMKRDIIQMCCCFWQWCSALILMHDTEGMVRHSYPCKSRVGWRVEGREFLLLNCPSDISILSLWMWSWMSVSHGQRDSKSKEKLMFYLEGRSLTLKGSTAQVLNIVTFGGRSCWGYHHQLREEPYYTSTC